MLVDSAAHGPAATVLQIVGSNGSGGAIERLAASDALAALTLVLQGCHEVEMPTPASAARQRAACGRRTMRWQLLPAGRKR